MRPPDWLGVGVGAAQWRAWRLNLDALRARAGRGPESVAHIFGALLACPGAHPVPARIWEGETASGIRVHAFITRVAIRQEADDAAEFERELQTHRPLSPEVPAYSLRLIL